MPALKIPENPEQQENQSFRLKTIFAGLAAMPRVVRLVWSASPLLTGTLAFFTILRGITPLATITISRLLLDSVVNALLHTHTIATIWPPVMLQLLVSLLDRLCGIIANMTQQLLQDRTQDAIQLQILKKAESLDLSFFEDAEFYDKLRHASSDASYKPLNMVMQTFSLIRTSITLLSMLGLLFHLAWWLGLIALLIPIPSFLADTHYGYRTYWLARRQSPLRRMLQYLVRLMTIDDYAKEIKLFQTGSFFIDRYHELAEQLYQENKRLTIKRIILDYAFSVLPIIVNAAIYLYVALQAVVGRITLGGLTQYTQAVNQVGTNFQMVLDGISSAYENNLFVGALFEFFAYTPRISSPRHPRSLETTEHGLDIEFRDVSFTYPEKQEPALQHISFHIYPGETVALVGYNGAGKTTLVKLLTRLYDPDEGEILINGQNIKEYAIADLHTHIGVIFQDFVRYHFAVRENIGLGAIEHIENVPMVKSAAEKSGAAPMIDRLAQGYETTLGKWFKAGVQLSGGEWQKIAIARAFMRNAALLILDEPTSALDAQAEYDVFVSFRDLTEGKTSVYISHRFSTVRRADRIFVLEYGKLIESGSHDELISLEGRYAELFNLQAQAYR